jgi:hypothetical protein
MEIAFFQTLLIAGTKLIAALFIQAGDSLAPVYLQYRKAGAAEESQTICSMASV